MSRFGAIVVLLVLAVPAAAQSPAAPDTTTAAPAPAAPAATPPDFPRGRVSGYTFGDAYYNLAGDPTRVYDASGADAGQANIDAKKPIARDLNGFQIRRVYFQLDNDLSLRFSTRFRLEADGRALTSDGKVGVLVKAAYLRARNAVPRGDFLFGMVSTPTFETAEDFWQYRAIEKTVVDFRALRPSADFGVALRGFLDPGHHLGYHAMIGDGTGQRPEVDRYKVFYLALPMRFGDLRLEPYADYQPVRARIDRVAPVQADSAAVNQDQALFHLFAGYELRRAAVGLELVDRVNHAGPARTQEPRGISLFARAALASGLGAFARLDHWNADQRATDRVDSRLWIAGLDWKPLPDVHLMPNVEWTEYLPRGGARAPAHHDLQARVTFYYRYSRPQS
jgi:hypothetical protein